MTDSLPISQIQAYGKYHTMTAFKSRSSSASVAKKSPRVRWLQTIPAGGDFGFRFFFG